MKRLPTGGSSNVASEPLGAVEQQSAADQIQAEAADQVGQVLRGNEQLFQGKVRNTSDRCMRWQATTVTCRSPSLNEPSWI